MKIDQIRFETRQNLRGTVYERVGMWIAGVPLYADLVPRTERIAKRIAEEEGIEIVDVRKRG